MADNNNKFNSTVESLFSGMDSFVSAKTVVGDAVTVNDTIIVPLVDVAFGVGAGAFSGEGKNNAGGGLGAKLSPSAVLVIQNGQTKLVNVKNQDTMTKILDMVPDIVPKFTPQKLTVHIHSRTYLSCRKREPYHLHPVCNVHRRLSFQVSAEMIHPAVVVKAALHRTINTGAKPQKG